MNGLERWHHVMKEGDMETLYDLLHPDCVFIYRPWFIPHRKAAKSRMPI